MRRSRIGAYSSARLATLEFLKAVSSASPATLDTHSPVCESHRWNLIGTR